MKVKIFNNERNSWWKPNYIGYTTDKKEAGIYDLDELTKAYGKSFITFKKTAKNYLVEVKK